MKKSEDYIDFTIGEKLGEGSYGRVHKCTLTNGKVCAVKLIKKTNEGISSPLEMSIMTSIRHENLNCSLETTQDMYHIYIIQDLAEYDLEHCLRNNIPINKNMWYGDMLKGLRCLHDQGIIHCDIKPANVLITKEGVAKLSDYSHSVIILEKKDRYFQHRVGSPRYSAPEVLSGAFWSREIDVWSLGCIFFEMSTKIKFLSNMGSLSDAKIVEKLSSLFFTKVEYETEIDKKIICNYMLQIEPSRRLSCKYILLKLFRDSEVRYQKRKIDIKDSSEESYLKKVLLNKTKDLNVINLAERIEKSVPSIPCTLCKVEACFLLATRILRGTSPFNLTRSMHGDLLEMEYNICLKSSFLF